VLRYCLRYLRRPADAEDALQQTFLQAHRALDRGVEPAAEAAWLLAIARNVCLTRSDALRRRATSEVSTEADAVVDGTALLLPDDDLAEDVRAALAGLPDRQRNALFLREWHELSYAEIARALGTTEAAVETLVFRARRTLARELEPLRRRRAVGLTGLLGWVRNGLAPVAAKVAVGAAAATVTAGAVATAVVERSTASNHVPAPAPAAAVVGPLAPAPTRARRLVHVARAHPPRATHALRLTHHALARSTPPATAAAAPSATLAPDPAPASVSPPVAPAPPHPAPVEQVPAHATTTPSVETPAASAAASVVSQAASTASSAVDTVAAAAADAVPAAAPVTTIASGTVDKTAATVSQTADAAAATVGGTVSKLLPGH
jgi:RNA polymerase sigma-70 factor (ECF subfamily)